MNTTSATSTTAASPSTKSELTIVIPAKNEAKLIPRLLTSLMNQDYEKMPSTGMFVFFDRKRFSELGGFHEQILFAEDYRLSQQVDRKRFSIVRGGVYTTNRRFKRMGHLKVGWLFLTTALNYWNEKYFLRDHKYWEPEELTEA